MALRLLTHAGKPDAAVIDVQLVVNESAAWPASREQLDALIVEVKAAATRFLEEVRAIHERHALADPVAKGMVNSKTRG